MSIILAFNRKISVLIKILIKMMSGILVFTLQILMLRKSLNSTFNLLPGLRRHPVAHRQPPGPGRHPPGDQEGPGAPGEPPRRVRGHHLWQESG